MTFTIDRYTFVGILAGKILKTPYAVLLNGPAPTGPAVSKRIGELQPARDRFTFYPFNDVARADYPTQAIIDQLVTQLLDAARARKAQRETAPTCCMNNDTGCFDEHCTCVCDACRRVRAHVAGHLTHTCHLPSTTGRASECLACRGGKR